MRNNCFQKKGKTEFVLTAVSLEHIETSKTHLFILFLSLTLGSSSSFDNKKKMDTFLAIQQFCCAAIDKNTQNYFKWE